MESKIVKVEDVMKIVGVQSYIDALSLDMEKLILEGYQKEKASATFHFAYDDKKIDLRIDKNSNIKELKCSCHVDYCSHIALSVMYLLAHETLLKQVINELNSEYDPHFNHFLFDQLTETSEAKRPLFFEVILKDCGQFTYELQLKIGEAKKYVLKKQLERFLECYRNGEGEVEFGKNFTYDPSKYYFGEEDQKIIEFLETYLDSQVTNYRNFYGYYPTTTIYLSGRALTSFLQLLRNRDFIIEQGYYQQQMKGIVEGSPFKVSLKELGTQIEVDFDYPTMEPFTEDFHYVSDDKQIYHVGKDVAKLLALLLANHKKKLLFEEKELPTFSTTIFPKLQKLDQTIEMEENVAQKFVQQPLKMKYYFSREKEEIVGEVKVEYQQIEKNIFDKNNQFGDAYVVRDFSKEQEALFPLYRWHFERDGTKFVLKKEDDLIAFLEEGLTELAKTHDIYISKNLKDVRVYRKTMVQTSFGIGRDHILTYEFQMEHVESSELSQILDAIHLKKKYYKLKSGDYLSLEQEPLEAFGEVMDQLDLGKKALKEGKATLPSYQSIFLSQMADEYEFISMEESARALLDRFHQYKELDLTLPQSEQNILRDYQEVGIRWMATLEKCGFGGILADEMGLGKSLQTIEYIKLRLREENDSKFLLVVPTSLIYNWEAEFQKFGPELSYQIINGNKKDRMNQLKTSASIFLTTYGLLRQDIEAYQELSFDTCIIDEAQAIKNIQAETTKAVKQIRAKTKFALTGTPIENSILELWSIFDFILPGLLPNLTKFRGMYSIKVIEERPEKLEVLNKMIAPFILRRKKKDVLKDLPDKIENHVLVELKEEQKKIYFAQLEKTKQELDEVVAGDGYLKSQILILSLLTKLRQICIHPSLFLEHYQGESSKFEELLDILNQVVESGHKVLVFSQFPSALRLLEHSLRETNLTYYYLDGSTKSKERMRLVDAFNQDETNLFLISLKAGGTGLNLTSADIVIHLDPWWNPQVENQATDRTHRIGQKNVVQVVKLIAKGTIEEKIVALQEKKKRLSDQVIEGEDRDQIVLSKLSEQELRELLE